MRLAYLALALASFFVFALSASSKAPVKPVTEHCCDGGGGDTAVGKQILDRWLKN